MSAAEKIMAASTPEELFGIDASERKARHTYIGLAAEVHPDTSSCDHSVFARLSDLWTRARAKFADGSYGRSTLTLTTRKSVWHVGGLLYHGQIASIYQATDDSGRNVLFKAPRNSVDNDLIEAEYASLTKLADTQPSAAEHAFVPKVIEKLRFEDGGSKTGLVLEQTPPGLYSLQEVMDKLPEPLDGRNIAWIFRRLLAALILAEEADVVHCGIVPHHVLVNPDSHDLILWDWTASGPAGSHKIPYISRDLNEYYPEEATAREEVQFGTDAYMAARTMLAVGSNNMPRQMESWFKGVALYKMSHRPPDPVELLTEFDDLITNLWGKRRYVTFPMQP